MSTTRKVTDTDIFKMIDAAPQTSLWTLAAELVSKHFRSMQYLASRIICNAVTLDLVLNKSITPHSSDEIITCMRRRTRSLYTTVNAVFFPNEDKFEEYAQSVLGNKYDEIKALGLRTTNYIVHVISTDITNNYSFSAQEVLLKTYSYDDICENGVPQYPQSST